MKKIISLIMALMMFGTTAFADTLDGFIGLWQEYSSLKSYTGQAKVSLEINEPLLFLEDIPLEDDGIDYPLMISDLLKSTAEMDFSVNMSEDFKAMKMAMSVAYDVPVSLNEDFKLEAFARIGMWLDYDISDPDAPHYRVIMKIPFESKYQVIDMPADELRAVMDIITPEAIDVINAKALEIIKNNAEITRTRDGYRVALDNEGFFAYMGEAFAMAEAYITDETDKEAYSELISAINWAKDNMTILGEDGMTLEYKVDARGRITLALESIHLDFNIYDLAELLGDDTEGLLRERADVNITLKSEMTLSGHNATEAVFPEITEENAEYIGSYEDDNYYGTPLFLNNEVYYPVDEICEYANGEFTADYADGVLTVVNIEDSVFTVSGTAITMGENVWEMEKPQLTESDGVVYATEEVFDVAGFGVSTHYNTVTKKFYCYGWVKSYVYFPAIFEEPEVIEEVEEYIPPYLDAYVSSDQVPYIEDGETFIPVYDLFKAMYPGEFAITMESLDYKATRENHYGIENISVKVGSNSIWVDEEEITFEKPVVNVANIFRAPLEFVENMGFTVNSIWVYEGTGYDLSMPNPNYVE